MDWELIFYIVAVVVGFAGWFIACKVIEPYYLWGSDKRSDRYVDPYK